MQIDYKFIITDDMIQKCTDFAEKSVSTSADKYARRNQFNVEKIKKDILIGKIGEQGAWNILSKVYADLSSPDYAIYDKKQKKYNPDMIDSSTGIKVACKTQDFQSSMLYGDSWVFQNNGSYDTDKEIFKKDLDSNNLVTFISTNFAKKTGEIRSIVKVDWLKQHNMFKPMKLKHLQNNKVAVYLEDLQKFSAEMFQI